MSNTWIICLQVGDNLPKGGLIPNNITFSHEDVIKDGDHLIFVRELNDLLLEEESTSYQLVGRVTAYQGI